MSKRHGMRKARKPYWNYKKPRYSKFRGKHKMGLAYLIHPPSRMLTKKTLQWIKDAEKFMPQIKKCLLEHEFNRFYRQYKYLKNLSGQISNCVNCGKLINRPMGGLCFSCHIKDYFEISREEYLKIMKSPCVQCGSNKHKHLDHIIPRSEGGLNITSNYQVLCRDCHWKKHPFMVYVKQPA